VNESQSGSSPARDQVSDAAGQVQEKVRETAQDAKAKAGDSVRQQVDTRSTQAGQQARSIADAIRQSSEQLRSQQKGGAAKVLDGSAERTERLGAYLEQSSADDILRDVENFARRQPWLVAAGAFMVGLAASRFMKASSSRRYRDGGSMDFADRQAMRGYTSEPAYIPPATPVVPATSVGEPPVVSPSREGY
jgi:hypothetical protein